MIDSTSFHSKAAAAKPQQVVKHSTIWVGVLHTEKKPSDELTTESFLWIKCHGKITAATIREQYESTSRLSEIWFLRHEFKLANPSETMANLNTYNDNVIAFEAVRASDTSRLAARQPLQPTERREQHKLAALHSEPQIPKGLKPVHSTIQSPLIDAGDENFSTSNFPSSTRRSAYPGAESRNFPGNHPGLKLSSPRVASRFSSQTSRDNTPTPPQPRAKQGKYPPWLQSSDLSRVSPYSEDAALSMPTDHTGSDPEARAGRERRVQTENSHLRSTSTAPDRAIDDGTQEEMPVTAPYFLQPPAASAELEEQRNKTFQLQTLLKNASPQMLEASVEQGVLLLDSLKVPLLDKMANSPDADQWIQQINNLRKQAVKTKTVIGVVGNTGAGKSSVINAMLDEERLVPTNCMRACTAVVTEISYNTEENLPYHAQIEFITAADWERELKTLFQDLIDVNGKVSADSANEDTDAGIAYAKIKAVYPRKTKEVIANSSIQSMQREVSHILGNSRDIKESDSQVFYKKLQSFVDSKEKSTGNKDREKKRERTEMEFWPLIRVVRIHVKSPALATGAVVVDLPGVHDANAARAAVAESYMKQCTGLWIVAPINRAVDDKAAKSLLGESFKRQLKMDGGFSAVTFICSKTDDISLMEAQDTLGLDEEMGPQWDEMDRHVREQKFMEKQLEELKDSKAVYSEAINDADEQVDVWEGLREQTREGKQAFAPKSGGKKRKFVEKDKSRKKRRRSTSDDEDIEESDFEDDRSEEEEREPSDVEPEIREPLTEDEVSAKLQELKATKKEARSQKAEITDKTTALREEMERAKAAETKINSRMSALCISGRNKYSKGAIQQDFAAGIKELDQELAAEEDEENFNPDVEARNYEEVACELPVFCVSSRGYQKLQGRLRKEPSVPGFTSIEETEIPQLQAHCEKLTETGRTANCRSFINKLSHLLNSLTLWASSDGTGAKMTPEHMAREARYLQKGLKGLESGLEKAVGTACSELSDEFSDNIYDKYETAISNATSEAIETAFHWGRTVNRENRAAGGLHWATYKAICRRNGAYSNAQGPHEWNLQLAEPMMKFIASGWEKAFTRRTPMVTAAFARNAAARLREFHGDIEGRARKIGAGIAGLVMLKHQVAVYETILKDISKTVKDTVNANQKEINREFTPVIERAMERVYTICSEERGPGSYFRMKAAMNSHVAHERFTMFQQSADHIKKLLSDMLKEVDALMSEKTDEVFLQVQRDYRSVLGGGDVSQDGEILPKQQRLARKEMMRIIDGVESVFRRFVGLEVEDDDQGEKGEQEADKKDGCIARQGDYDDDSGPPTSIDGLNDCNVGQVKQEAEQEASPPVRVHGGSELEDSPFPDTLSDESSDDSMDEASVQEE